MKREVRVLPGSVAAAARRLRVPARWLYEAAAGLGIVVAPPDEGDADILHIGSSRPGPPPQRQSVCAECGRTVWFADPPIPGASEACEVCFRKAEYQ